MIHLHLPHQDLVLHSPPFSDIRISAFNSAFSSPTGLKNAHIEGGDSIRATLRIKESVSYMQACIDDTFCPFNHIITRKRYRFACIFFLCVMYIKMLLNGIRIVKISYFRKAYWKEKQVCHFQIFYGNLKKYLPKKAVYMVS